MESEQKPQLSLKKYWQLLVEYLNPHKALVGILAFVSILNIALKLVNPQIVRFFLDAAEQAAPLEKLTGAAALFMGIALLNQVIQVLVTYLGENIAWMATNALRADLALHCLKLDMSFHKRYKSGELIERLDGDVTQLANFFSQLVIQIGSNVLLILGVLTLLWVQDWRIGLFITIALILGVSALDWLTKKTVPRWQAVREVEARLFGFLEEWLNGTEEIQTSGAKSFVMLRLFESLRARWRETLSATRLHVLVAILPMNVFMLAYIAAHILSCLDNMGEWGMIRVAKLEELMAKQPQHRPRRVFPNAKRVIVECDLEACPHCKERLKPRLPWHMQKTVQTLQGPLFVAGKSKKCINPKCSHTGKHYYASKVLMISLPKSTYGLDVLAHIGWQHEHEHKQLVEIQRDLNERGILVNERNTGKLYRQFLALLGVMSDKTRQRLEETVSEHGGVIWALDALQPEGHGTLLYVLYEVLSSTPVAACQLEGAKASELIEWLRSCQLRYPVLATLSDGEKAIIEAFRTCWPEAPQQRCQLHFLNNLVEPVLEYDTQPGKQIRKDLGGLPKVPENEPPEGDAPFLQQPDSLETRN